MITFWVLVMGVSICVIFFGVLFSVALFQFIRHIVLKLINKVRK